MLVHPHYIVLIIFVFLHQKFKQFCFLFSKLMIDFCVTVDFYCNIISRLVIKTANHLCKATFTQDLQYFESVKNLVTSLYNEVALLVIALTFAFCLTAYCPFDNISWIVNDIITFKTLFIIFEFFLFKVCQDVRVILGELAFFHRPPCIRG